MWKLVFLTLLLNQLMPLAKSENILPSMVKIIKMHFREREGTNLFFCQKIDALMMLKNIVNAARSYNVNHLRKDNMTKRLQITFMTPQIMGIFLDLTCSEGQYFLKENSDFFNASFRWLLYTIKPAETAELLQPTRFMTDSDVTLASPNGSDIILQDVYRMFKTLPIISTDIQRWSEEGTVTQLADPPPRVDFQGVTLTASLLMVDTVINKSEEIPLLYDPSLSDDGKSWYGLTLFTHMAEYYNYTYRFIFSDVWGYPLKNGSWSGMVGQVKRHEADMGLSAAHFSVARTKVIDFVGIIDITRVCFAFLQPKLFGSYKALILPLDVTVWACLLVTAVAGVVVFRIVANYDDTSQQNDSWSGSFLLVLAAISQQGIPDSTDKLPTRIIYLSLLGVSFLAAVYYNTAILNGLLLPAPNAIQNMDQLLASDMKIATSDTKYLLYDMTHNDTLTVKLRKKMEKSKLPNGGILTVSGGVDLVKKGGLALYILTRESYQEINYKFTAAEICSLTEIEKYRPLPTGGIVQNNSPFKEIFNRKFTLMRETGIMSRGKLLWNPRKPECDWKQDALVIGAEPLSMAYAVLSLGTIVAIVLVFIEVHTFRKQKKLLRRNHSSKFFMHRQPH
uniref:Uncharacterized protein n=1 Tax=Rhodnius prolixus TaxID=13249 RepID=T1HDK4_RHOPR